MLACLDCAGTRGAHAPDRSRWVHAEFDQKPSSDRTGSSEHAPAVYQDFASATQHWEFAGDELRTLIVFQEAASGAKADRAQLCRVVAQLGKGDALMVTRLDRLARSTRDLLNTLAKITAKGAGFRSLHDTWADTTTAHGRLMLTVLGGLAEFERELIRARSADGRERAKARGVRTGRKPKLTNHQRREAARRRDYGEETLAEIGRSYNVSGWTIRG